MGTMPERLSDNLLNARRKRTPAYDGLPFELSLESVSEADKFDRRQDKERVEQFNNDVKGWSIHVTRRLRANVRAMVKEDRRLSASIAPNIYFDHKYAKEANRIGFSFVREGVYIHKGAGRGYGGSQGSKWKNRYGEEKETNVASLFKMGTDNRKEIPWFDPIISQELLQLADMVADYSATMQIDATRIYIDR